MGFSFVDTEVLGSFKRVTTFATLMSRFPNCPRRLKTARHGLIPRNDDFVPGVSGSHSW